MLYRPAWLLLYIPLRLAFRLRFVHRGRLPRSGPVVVSGNHVSYLDPVLIALTSWRPISYMAKVELFEGARWFAWLLRRLNAFPVRRGEPDRTALSEATRRIERPGVVGIFPEGTRVDDSHGGADAGLGEAYGGAAMVALRSAATVVPVGIFGTQEAMPRGAKGVRFRPVTIAFGEPIRPEDVPEGTRRERVDALTAMLMERIAAAVREASGGRE